MSDGELKVVDAFDLDDELRTLLKPGEMMRDAQGRRHRLPRYFYEVPDHDFASNYIRSRRTSVSTSSSLRPPRIAAAAEFSALPPLRGARAGLLPRAVPHRRRRLGAHRRQRRLPLAERTRCR
jgi:hypothetical protein